MKAATAFLGLLWQTSPTRTVSLLLLMVFAGLSEGLGVLLLLPLLDLLQGQGGTPGGDTLSALGQSLGINPGGAGLGVFLLLFLLLMGARNALIYARELQAIRLQLTLVDRLRERCLQAVLGAQWRWLSSVRRSDQANLLLTDVNRIGLGVNHSLALLAGAVTMAIYIGAGFLLSWSMSAIALGSCVLVLLLLSGQRRSALSLGMELGKANRALQGQVQEGLAGLKLTKILGREDSHLERFRRAMGLLRQRQLEFTGRSAASRALYQTAGAALLALYLFLGLRGLNVAVAELLTLVLIFARLIPLFTSALQLHHHCLHALPALHEVRSLLDECRRAAEPSGQPGEFWPVNEAITLDEVSVRYEGRHEDALHRISACFPARTTTAIVGHSGAGKSTLADVLMGLLPPDSGTVCIDGRAMAAEQRLRWRRSVSYVPQDTFLFHDSVRNNLLWACPQARDEELREALQRAAADFVFSLPEGLDTVVGDGGVLLSGGERQRLALARALLQRPALLILDEATSALDRDNEARIRTAIERLHGDLTVVLIGHRLATLEHADQVLVLQAGRLVAQGSWAEVRERAGALS